MCAMATRLHQDFASPSGWSDAIRLPCFGTGFHGARGLGTVFGRCQEWAEKSEISERIPT